MKHSFWGYFVIAMGLAIIVIMLLIQRMTTTTEEDFYLAREVMEAAMIDAVDYGTYRTTGKLVMSEQKFVEVFLRRFSESVTNNKTYQISFYDIYEEPPKATIKIRTRAGTTELDNESFDINLDTLVTGILETIYSTSNEQKVTTKSVKRYITCNATADGYNLDGSVYQYDLTRGATVLLKYDSIKYKNETDGINSVCNKYFSGDEYCKGIYQGSTIYVKRKELTVSKPACKNKVVEFDSVGGTKCDTKSLTNGSELGTLCTPKKDGYDFNGWYDQTGCKGTKAETTTTITKDMKYYACWKPKKLTLTYNNTGGSGCTVKTIEYNVKVGDLCKPSRSGYTFAGWSKTNSGSVNVNSNTAFTSNTTIYAVWSSACSKENPEGCSKVRFCRDGNVYAYKESNTNSLYAGTVKKQARLYKIKEVNGMTYVKLIKSESQSPTGEKYYSSYYGDEYFWIHSNCLYDASRTDDCEPADCP